MPKRSNEEKISRYRRKLRKLETQQRKYNRIVYSSDDSSQSDNGVESVSEAVNVVDNEINQENELAPVSILEPVTPELDPDTLSALGEATEEIPEFGPKIHEKLSHLWLPILKKGLNKDAKERLIKNFTIPENCSFLQAPKLNPEISAAITESARTRDKKIEAVQQQLGQAITALNKGLELLLEDGKDRLQAIKLLSDSCRILCDLHHIETESRRRLITPGLDKAFLNIIQNVERDDSLFGNKLSEKIKATKVIEKQGLQIKKPPINPKTQSTPTSTNYQSTASHSRQPGNWMGPPRFSSNRGGRAGQRGRTTPAGRKIQPAGSTQQKQSTRNRPPRVTGQQ